MKAKIYSIFVICIISNKGFSSLNIGDSSNLETKLVSKRQLVLNL